MKVRKSEKRDDPGYPSHRQFAEYRALLGIAALGLGTTTLEGCKPRLAGEPPIVPKVSAVNAPVATPKPLESDHRLRGVVLTPTKRDIPAAPSPPASFLGQPAADSTSSEWLSPLSLPSQQSSLFRYESLQKAPAHPLANLPGVCAFPSGIDIKFGNGLGSPSPTPAVSPPPPLPPALKSAAIQFNPRQNTPIDPLARLPVLSTLPEESGGLDVGDRSPELPPANAADMSMGLGLVGDVGVLSNDGGMFPLVFYRQAAATPLNALPPLAEIANPPRSESFGRLPGITAVEPRDFPPPLPLNEDIIGDRIVEIRSGVQWSPLPPIVPPADSEQGKFKIDRPHEAPANPLDGLPPLEKIAPRSFHRSIKMN